MYYGGKIRFTHSLVMAILFKSGTLWQKISSIFTQTWEHSFNLGLFAFIYKTIVCILRRYFKTKNKSINFIAGVIGAYFMWSKGTNINIQIVLYLLSRNILAIANMINDKYLNFNHGFTLTSMLVWGVVMFLFEYKPTSLQHSLFTSMDFIYKDSDGYKNWRDLIPFYIPNSVGNDGLLDIDVIEK
jgi:peroxisomal membrane protein 4